MKIEQLTFSTTEGWLACQEAVTIDPQLVLYFGHSALLSHPQHYQSLKQQFPDAVLLGCSTAGEILGDEVNDGTIAATAIRFKQTPIACNSLLIADYNGDSRKIGHELAANLPEKHDLAAVFVLSDGLEVNGSELVDGVYNALSNRVIVTGGLAGDGTDFRQTLVGCNSAPEPGRVAIVGFYGSSIRVGHGSAGGWDTFGPFRTITRSSANILYSLDDRPALDLYKDYLGDQSKELPGSALLFPLMIKPADQQEGGTVRTILGVDEKTSSMTFAGDMPEGYRAQLMMANFDRLIDGASTAAEFASDHFLPSNPDKPFLAILISCVGRKMVLGQRVSDEVEAVQEILGSNAVQAGFYSYGEISPHVDTGTCELHNQTMTITTLYEE